MDYRSERPLRDNERELIELFQSLNRKYSNLIIVVEGKRDVSVLRNLGVKASIIKSQTSKTRNQLVDYIAAKAGSDGEILLLTDFDADGTEIALFLKQGLEHHKVRILHGVRNRIRKLMGNWRCIEEMIALFKRLDSPEPSR